MSTTLPLLETRKQMKQPRCVGELCVQKDKKQIRLPLKSVNIQSTVVDRIAEVTLEQSYGNQHKEPLEAVYIFPLSGGSVVSSFEMKVEDVIIKGHVEERQQARANYQQALDQGKQAALLEQERDDVFTMSVGNLPPGKEIVVTLNYSEPLPYYEDGSTELRLPLVVAPRYIPGKELERDQIGDGTAGDTDSVPDASRITPPRLLPGVNPNIDLSITVDILSNKGVEDLSCSQHATKLSCGNDRTSVTLSRTDELLDRDFVLRWTVASEQLTTSLIIYTDPEQDQHSYGMLSLLPPKNIDILSSARDVVFLLDRSGSMQGEKMVSAVRACSVLLSSLGPTDRFAIGAFDNTCEWMPGTGGVKDFITADEAGIEHGAKYLRDIYARGGTEMHAALTAALAVMRERSEKLGRMPVIVVLTDGEVGNESEILKRIQLELGDNRVFTVGIDTAVNDGFLRRLAAIGGGTATFVEPGTQLEEALDRVAREIGTPILTGITFTDSSGSIKIDSIAPSRVPDLFEGRASKCFFRIKGGKELAQSCKIALHGKLADGSSYSEQFSPQTVELKALAQLWAKAHIVDLEDEFRIAKPAQRIDLQKQITELAVAHSLLTKFTAFIAVYAEKTIDPSTRRKIVQAVHAPALWQADMDPMTAMFAGSYGSRASSPMPQSPPPPQSAPQRLYSQPASSAPQGWGAPAAGMPQQQQPPQSAPPASIKYGAAPSSPSPSNQANTLAESIRRKIAEATNSGSGASNDSWRAEGASSEDPKLVKAYREFESVLLSAHKQILADQIPDATKIETARTALLDALASSPKAAQLGALQKFLRASAVQLIAATSGAAKVTNQLKQLIGRLDEEWKGLEQESLTVITNGKENFWQHSI